MTLNDFIARWGTEGAVLLLESARDDFREIAQTDNQYKHFENKAIRLELIAIDLAKVIETAKQQQ